MEQPDPFTELNKTLETALAQLRALRDITEPPKLPDTQAPDVRFELRLVLEDVQDHTKYPNAERIPNNDYLDKKVAELVTLIAQRETAARIDENTKMLDNVGGVMVHVDLIHERLAELTKLSRDNDESN